MEIFQNLALGFSVATDPVNLIYVIIGVVFGVIIGALPGLGPTAGVAILLPLTFGATPVAGIIMLAGIYYGAMYGGAITSILLNVPGDSCAVATTFDGYPLAKKGRAGAALGMAAFASFIAGTICVVAFMFLAPAIAEYALSFGPPEYFALMALGLSTVAGMTGKIASKGYISALIGLFLGFVGLDLVQGIPRYTFGVTHFYGGIGFIPVAMGLFGIAELFSHKKDTSIKINKKDYSLRKLLPTKDDWKNAWAHILRGTGLGFFIGALPGAGATIASFISYEVAKKTSKRGKEFGTGVVEGVAAPESANNAGSIGAMIPMITLGVPGSGSTAIMLGALLMFGLTPGPTMFQQNPDFCWGLIGSMYIGNTILLLVAILALPLFVKVLNISTPVLKAVVLAFILLGTYSLNNAMFDVGLAIAFGVLGLIMKKLEYPSAPLILALILGGMLENALRQSLIISGGSIGIFFDRPISKTILIITIIAICWPLIKKIIKSLYRVIKPA